MNHLQKHFSASLIALAALLSTAPIQGAWAATAPDLGAASNFVVLGGTAVTCTTSSMVIGDVGVSPGSTFTNTLCAVAGTVHVGDSAAAAARTGFLNAYDNLPSCTTTITGNLAGANLTPGVYCVDAVAKAGTLTLTGGTNDVWIFRVAGALTGTNFSVVMAGGGQPCNVYWAPSAAATMTDSTFKGNILAGDATLGSITLTRGTLAGRVLANIAVTMTGASLIGCDASGGLSNFLSSLSCKDKDHDGHDNDKEHKKCNQGVGNGSEDGCDPGHSDQHNPFGSNDEHGGTPGKPGRKGGNK